MHIFKSLKTNRYTYQGIENEIDMKINATLAKIGNKPNYVLRNSNIS